MLTGSVRSIPDPDQFAGHEFGIAQIRIASRSILQAQMI